MHTLSVKRAADLKRDARAALLRHDVTGKMLSLSRTAAREMGMIPFYMYRQKNMLGNHENVSYCRPGCESPYNIHIMEEDQTIFAFGAGGVSKLSVPVPDAEPNILRSFNVKSVEDYLASVEISKTGIRGLERYAKKYGIDYAIRKDTSEVPPRYLVFFKAPDAEAFNSAFKEYSASLLNKDKRPSVLAKLHELVQAAAELPGKVRHKEQERGL